MSVYHNTSYSLDEFAKVNSSKMNCKSCKNYFIQ